MQATVPCKTQSQTFFLCSTNLLQPLQDCSASDVFNARFRFTSREASVATEHSSAKFTRMAASLASSPGSIAIFGVLARLFSSVQEESLLRLFD